MSDIGRGKKKMIYTVRKIIITDGILHGLGVGSLLIFILIDLLSGTCFDKA